MVLEARPPAASRAGDGRAGALAAIAAASRSLAEGTTLGATLEAIAAAAADATSATVAVARVLEQDGVRLRARAVHTASPALAAVLQGSSVPVAEVTGEADDPAELPPAVVAAAEQAGAGAALLVPVRSGGAVLGSLELMRPRGAFTVTERLVARVAADHVAAAVRTLAPDGEGQRATVPDGVVELAGEAIAAGSDEALGAEEVARVAVQATAALACLVWAGDDDGGIRLLAAAGTSDVASEERARPLAERAFAAREPTLVEHEPGGVVVVGVPLGRPPVHVLQLFFAGTDAPGPARLARLGTFGVRVAHALRAAQRAGALRVELERTRALLALVAQANEELSLAHTLETAIERIAEVLGVNRIGVYLRDEAHLLPAAGRALAGPHAPVAERLLDLALGPFRGRGMLVIADAAADPALTGLRSELAETGIEAAAAVPLLVSNEVVGLLAVYPRRGSTPTANEAALLSALAAQLAVSIQNAQLHEQATELGAELEQVLVLERQAARQLRALYEISRSFAQSLSLDATLDAVARTVVELLGVDAAVIRMPDARGELLLPRALHVADVRLGDPIRSVLSRPMPLSVLPRRRLVAGRPLVLNPVSAAQRPVHELLVPFLEKGSTAVVIPIATPSELLGTIELLSLDPERPIGRETLELALSVAAQAALAIDNARLYQHQKEFADTMQRSLLPQEEPQVAGLEVGDVYAASARVDVGGDLYDFLELEDGRLAVVLGDVTGHGVEAAADMAMAKYVFRSLAREHPDPGEFLAAANDVVCGEVGAGKFVTMLYLTIDPVRGEVRCASGGHPRPRVVLPGGEVRPLPVRGLALGIDPGQEYAEAREDLPPGGAVVLYTDGVIEARRDGELYGDERLDGLLADRLHLPARELADAVLGDCREFAGGDLPDDCAVVVIKRTAG